MVKVLVCGGRKYNDKSKLFSELDRLHEHFKFTCVVHGAAPGADALAHMWASKKGLEVKPYPADLSQGNEQGPLRNQRMLDENPDIALVVAFPGNNGTADMVNRSALAGKLVEMAGL